MTWFVEPAPSGDREPVEPHLLDGEYERWLRDLFGWGDEPEEPDSPLRAMRRLAGDSALLTRRVARVGP